MVFALMVSMTSALTVVGSATSNPVRDAALEMMKANGYVEYTPLEAYKLAKRICAQCHSDERIKLYCSRCGPPFVAVVPHMQGFIQNYKSTKPDLKIENITETQAVAIVQVWNALVGNWEGDFREIDIEKMVGRYPYLMELYKTPIEKRPIESALNRMDSMKIGHMSGMMEMQKGLGGGDTLN